MYIYIHICYVCYMYIYIDYLDLGQRIRLVVLDGSLKPDTAGKLANSGKAFIAFRPMIQVRKVKGGKGPCRRNKQAYSNSAQPDAEICSGPHIPKPQATHNVYTLPFAAPETPRPPSVPHMFLP